MEVDAIEAVLRSFRRTKWGWRAAVPGFEFLRQPVTLVIDTREFPTDEPPPLPNETELGLSRLILGGLSGVLAEAERQYRMYHSAVPQAVELAHEPQIWLSHRTMSREGPEHWAFVVGIAGAEDYGTHAEFVGLSCVGIWSGD
jgi:hypothetical protein